MIAFNDTHVVTQLLGKYFLQNAQIAGITSTPHIYAD